MQKDKIYGTMARLISKNMQFLKHQSAVGKHNFLFNELPGGQSVPDQLRSVGLDPNKSVQDYAKEIHAEGAVFPGETIVLDGIQYINGKPASIANPQHLADKAGALRGSQSETSNLQSSITGAAPTVASYEGSNVELYNTSQADQLKQALNYELGQSIHGNDFAIDQNGNVSIYNTENAQFIIDGQSNQAATTTASNNIGVVSSPRTTDELNNWADLSHDKLSHLEYGQNGAQTTVTSRAEGVTAGKELLADKAMIDTFLSFD